MSSGIHVLVKKQALPGCSQIFVDKNVSFRIPVTWIVHLTPEHHGQLGICARANGKWLCVFARHMWQAFLCFNFFSLCI